MTASRNKEHFAAHMQARTRRNDMNERIIFTGHNSDYLLAINAQFRHCICGKKIETLDSRPQRLPPCFTRPSTSTLLLITSGSAVKSARLATKEMKQDRRIK